MNVVERIPPDVVGHTFDCKYDSCTQSAKSNRGIFAYLCDHHIEVEKRARAQQAPHPPRQHGEPNEYLHTEAAMEVEKAAKGLVQTAKQLDAARRRLAPLLAQHEAAKRRYQEAVDKLPRA